MQARISFIVAFLLAVLSCAAGSATAGEDSLAPSFPIPNYTTSWLGNSYGGPVWVQRYADDMFTTPDGTCILATAWDEGGREYGIYKDGNVLGAASDTHGWGFGGGGAVTANSKYLFIAQSLGHVGTDDSGAVWPPKDITWFGVGRRTLEGKAAPFPGGKGHGATAAGGVFLTINEQPKGPRADIAGLAASERQLFVANPATDAVEVYDTETMSKAGSWPMPRAGHMAYDAATDSLWIFQKADGNAPRTIRHFTAAGNDLGAPVPLPPGAVPSALCVSPAGELLVADKGPAQQVLVFSLADANLPLVRTIGQKGGIYSGEPGKVGPLKFASPAGVGADKAGNIYVASSEGGTVLESYGPSGTRNWQVYGLEFVEVADLDPNSPTDAYTLTHHYSLDPAKPSGQDSAYTGYLVDVVGMPDDPRVRGKGAGSMFARRIGGKLILFGLDMNASYLQIYRSTGQGELTAPAGMIRLNHNPGPWPEHQPDANGWIWRDVNGNGRFDADEFESSTENMATTAWSIDSNGTVFFASYRWNGPVGVPFIRRLPCQGLDKQGNPMYSFKTAADTAAPAPFDDIRGGSSITRMEYVSQTDTMYLSGFTPEHKNTNRDWKTSGPVICRYDQWSTHPRKRWQKDVPFETAQGPSSNHATPDAFSVAGNRLFNGYLKDGEIRVYDTEDGSYLGSLQPGPEVDKTSGWIDTMYGVRAHQLANGDYLIFAEEVWHEKVLMYRLAKEHAARK